MVHSKTDTTPCCVNTSTDIIQTRKKAGFWELCSSRLKKCLIPKFVVQIGEHQLPPPYLERRLRVGASSCFAHTALRVAVRTRPLKQGSYSKQNNPDGRRVTAVRWLNRLDSEHTRRTREIQRTTKYTQVQVYTCFCPSNNILSAV